MRRRVVLPAPLGPSTASVSPGATARSTSTSRAPACALPCDRQRGHGAPSQRSRSPASTDHRDGEEDQAQEDGGVDVGVEEVVDRQRHRLGLAREAAGEGDGGAELAERPRPGQRGTGAERATDRRQRDVPEDEPRRRAQRARGVLEAAVDPAQRRLHGDDEERHAHERRGQHRGGPRVGELDVEPVVEVLTHHPASAEGDEQGDAADHGRDHHRQQHERTEQRSSGERRAWRAPRRSGSPGPPRAASAHRDTMSDSPSASRTSSVPRRSAADPHGARMTSASKRAPGSAARARRRRLRQHDRQDAAAAAASRKTEPVALQDVLRLGAGQEERRRPRRPRGSAPRSAPTQGTWPRPARRRPGRRPPRPRRPARR